MRRMWLKNGRRIFKPCGRATYHKPLGSAPVDVSLIIISCAEYVISCRLDICRFGLLSRHLNLIITVFKWRTFRLSDRSNGVQVSLLLHEAECLIRTKKSSEKHK